MKPLTRVATRSGVGAALVLVGLTCGTAFASWGLNVGAGSSGYTGSHPVPAQVPSVTAACTSPSGSTVKVTFTTVQYATSYTVWYSTGGAYNVLATGVSGSPYTTPSLTLGFTYTFKVQSVEGTWGGTNSAATSPGRTIGLSTCT